MLLQVFFCCVMASMVSNLINTQISYFNYVGRFFGSISILVRTVQPTTPSNNTNEISILTRNCLHIGFVFTELNLITIECLRH